MAPMVTTSSRHHGSSFGSPGQRGALAAAVLSLLLATIAGQPANANVRVGVGIGLPFFVAPPVVAPPPPPVYYAPPPYYYYGPAYYGPPARGYYGPAPAYGRPSGGYGAPPSQVVAKAQQELASNGFDPGPVDGRMGPRTRSAIMEYQRAHGMNVDGQLTQQVIDGLSAGH